MLKQFSDDDNPGAEKGRGSYYHIITVTFDEETILVQGGKAGKFHPDYVGAVRS